MQVVVDYVNGKSPPPKELDLVWQCERYHSLPLAGGILDQPHNLMMNMNIAINIYTAWSEWKKCDPENTGDWIKRNPKLWHICDDIIKSGKNG
jgi:hypothetical protein